MERTTIVRVLHGAHLFGTATEASDMDYFSVVLPRAADLMEGKAKFHDRSSSTNQGGRRNASDDTDDDRISLARFAELLASCAIQSLETIFAPDASIVSSSDVFEAMRARPLDFTGGDMAGAMSLCRAMARKWTPANGEAEAAGEVVEALVGMGVTKSSRGPSTEILKRLHGLVDTRHVGWDDDREMLRVCGKWVPGTVSLGNAFKTLHLIAAREDERRRKGPEARDFKAMSHAVRIAGECLEFSTTGRITLPRPDASFLLDIKRQRIPMPEALEILKESVAMFETAPQPPSKLDASKVEAFVSSAHDNVLENAVDAFQTSGQNPGV